MHILPTSFVLLLRHEGEDDGDVDDDDGGGDVGDGHNDP